MKGGIGVIRFSQLICIALDITFLGGKANPLRGGVVMCLRGIRYLALVILLNVTVAAAPQSAPNPSEIPIKHFIYIIQENQSFDRYFGTYPGANGIPKDLKLPYKPGGVPEVAPFHLHQTAIPHDLSHSWQAARTAYDGGKMDGFLWAEWPQALRHYWANKPVPQPDPNLIHPKPLTPGMMGQQGRRRQRGATLAERDGQFLGGRQAALPEGPPPDWVINTLSYYDWHELPNYWEYARRFTLCDNFFSSLMGPSEPNHLYTVAAQSGGMVNNPPPGLANQPGVYTFPTMAELLENAPSPGAITIRRRTRTRTACGIRCRASPLFKIVLNSWRIWCRWATSTWTLQITSSPRFLGSYPRRKIANTPADAAQGMWHVTNLVNALMQSDY